VEAIFAFGSSRRHCELVDRREGDRKADQEDLLARLEARIEINMGQDREDLKEMRKKLNLVRQK
jgi:hypothetical protein